MIFHHTVRMENVGANLTAPTDFALFTLYLRQLLLALFPLFLVKTRLQDFNGAFTVLDLRSLRLTRHNDSGRDVRNAHGRIRRIDVLTACTTGAVGVDF